MLQVCLQLHTGKHTPMWRLSKGRDVLAFIAGVHPHPRLEGGGEGSAAAAALRRVLGNPAGGSGWLAVLLNRCGLFLSISIR